VKLKYKYFELLLVFLFILPLDIAFAISGPRLGCSKTLIPPVIDGKLDDACWTNTIEAGNFTLCGQRALAQEQTVFKIVYDDERLYIACKCYERILNPVLNQTHKFKAEKKERDSRVWLDDSIEFFIAPEQSSEYYHIVVNSAGTIYDSAGMMRAGAFDADIKSAAVVTDWGWIAETSIPLRSLKKAFPRPGETWTLNVCRTEQAYGEFSSWAPVDRRGFHSPDKFGYLRFGGSVPSIYCPNFQTFKTGRNGLSSSVINNSKSTESVTLKLTVSYERDEQVSYAVSREIPPSEKKDLKIEFDVDSRNRCIQMDIPSGYDWGNQTLLSSDIAVKPGKKYRFSAMIKALTEEASTFDCIYIRNDKRPQGMGIGKRYECIGSINPKIKGWQRINSDWYAEKDIDRIQIGAVRWNSRPKGTIWIDDVSLVEEGTFENIVPNGNFLFGNGKSQWPIMTKGVSLTDSYGAGAGYFSCFYELLQNGVLLYQSPYFINTIKNERYPINSRLVNYFSFEKKEPEFIDIKQLYIATGTAERVVLLLDSPGEEKINEVFLKIETPGYCRLIKDFANRELFSPVIDCKEKKYLKSGIPYNEYILTISGKAVSNSDDSMIWSLPVALIFKVDKGPGEEMKNADPIYFEAFLKDKKEKENTHRIMLNVLPPLNGKSPKELPLRLWGPFPEVYLWELSLLEKNLLLSKIGKAGFNYSYLNPVYYNSLNSLFLKYGLKPFTITPMIPKGDWPGTREYLEKYPEYCDITESGQKSKNIICPAHLLEENSPFRIQIKKVVNEYVKKYPYCLNWDLELCPYFQGYSPRNIELFRKMKKISPDIELSPEKIRTDYKKEWRDFRNWEIGEIVGIFRKYLKEANPYCIFDFYSAYQSPDSERYEDKWYGVDWRYIGPYVDTISCGYCQGPELTREAIRGRPITQGDLLFAGYDLDNYENVIFGNLVRGGSFLSFAEWLLDGRFFESVSRASSVAADFEDFFLNLEINKKNHAVDSDGRSAPGVSVLTFRGERLILLFNESRTEKQFEFHNLQLPANMVAIDYDSKRIFDNPAYIQATVLPQRVKAIYITGRNSHDAQPIFPFVEEDVDILDSEWPIFRWSDRNGRSNKYVLQYSKNADFSQKYEVKDIPVNYHQPDKPLHSGETYYWRVKAIDAISGASSGWSYTGRVVFSHELQELRQNQENKTRNISIESLGHWLPYQWQYTGFRKDYDIKYNGPYSLYVYNDGICTDEGLLMTFSRQSPTCFKLYKVEKGKTYSFSIYAKTKGDNLKIAIGIIFYDREGKLIKKEISPLFPGSHDWCKLTTGTLFAPEGATRMSFSISLKGAGSAWFDNFKLEKKE